MSIADPKRREQWRPGLFVPVNNRGNKIGEGSLAEFETLVSETPTISTETEELVE